MARHERSRGDDVDVGWVYGRRVGVTGSYSRDAADSPHGEKLHVLVFSMYGTVNTTERGRTDRVVKRKGRRTIFEYMKSSMIIWCCAVGHDASSSSSFLFLFLYSLR